MKAALKIFQICLILGLTACGASSKDRDPQAGDTNARKGVGSMSFKGRFTARERRLTLQDGSADGDVVCTYDSKADQAWISLGRMNGSTPENGLAFSYKGLKHQDGSVVADQTTFVLDRGDVSNPYCTIKSDGIYEGVYKGVVSCMDDLERAGWGKTAITAEFTCNFKSAK